nr:MULTISPECIES: toxin co-regulated pilus biosynthesis Q family protein [Achromobacter]
MQALHLAALFSAACLLSACGFVPPAPPVPPDSGRILINHAAPRTVLPGKTPAAIASADIPPIPVPEAPPKVQTAPAASDASAGPTRPPAPAPAANGESKDTPQTPLAPQPSDAAASSQVAAASASVVTVELTPQEPVSEPEVVAPPKQIWRISPQDGTVRQALVRWASDANWTFGPDQWELNFDLPIQAPAEFEADSFQEATQALSQAVAMSESPIRPCFYGNRVLRMVPFTRSCNRSPATQS